jgi:Uma2 family endonuclease
MVAVKKIPEKERYTYEDYESWAEDFRCEIIDGQVYALAQPLIIHQAVSGELYLHLRNFLKDKPCKVYYAPFAVRLHTGTDDEQTLEPDLVVICDMKKIEDGKACIGAPDIVIEILSPSSPSRDTFVKFQKYLKAGVREYWIVDPETKTVMLCVLDGNRYITEVYLENETLSSKVLEGLKINLSEIFEVD